MLILLVAGKLLILKYRLSLYLLEMSFPFLRKGIAKLQAFVIEVHTTQYLVYYM